MGSNRCAVAGIILGAGENGISYEVLGARYANEWRTDDVELTVTKSLDAALADLPLGVVRTEHQGSRQTRFFWSAPETNVYDAVGAC